MAGTAAKAGVVSYLNHNYTQGSGGSVGTKQMIEEENWAQSTIIVALICRNGS